LLHLKYILIGVFADMVAVQDMEPPDLFHGDGREDPDGEIDDCFAVSGRHALAPSGRGVAGHIDNVFFKTIVDG